VIACPFVAEVIVVTVAPVPRELEAKSHRQRALGVPEIRNELNSRSFSD
jgi:hypothetical protein